MGFGNFLGGAATGMQARQLLDINAQKEQNATKNDLINQVDTAVDGTMKTIASVIKAGKEARQSPDKIRAAVQPLLADVGGLYQRTGRDPSRLVNQIDAMVNAPSGTPAASSELGRINQDLSDGLISPEEAAAAKQKSTRPEKGPNTMESIYSKIAAGTELTPGETQIYNDRKKAASDMAIMFGMATGTITPGEDTPASSPTKISSTVPPTKDQSRSGVNKLLESQGDKPLAVPDEVSSKLKEGVITVFANGERWELRNGKPIQLTSLKQK